VLLEIKNMGGESEAAWRALLDNLVSRGLRTPELVIADDGSGLDKALAALWPDAPVQRGAVHKHRNLLAHAPDRLHDEVSADYNEMIYAKAARRSRPSGKPSSENGGSNAAPSPTAWQRQATDCSPSPACRKANGNRSEP
jgi:transposase-like protein